MQTMNDIIHMSDAEKAELQRKVARKLLIRVGSRIFLAIAVHQLTNAVVKRSYQASVTEH